MSDQRKTHINYYPLSFPVPGEPDSKHVPTLLRLDKEFGRARGLGASVELAYKEMVLRIPGYLPHGRMLGSYTETGEAEFELELSQENVVTPPADYLHSMLMCNAARLFQDGRGDS